MKKIHKILFLILMLALIVSAFAVVALATDEEEKTVEAYPAKINGWDFTFESVKDGTAFQNSSEKKGKFVAVRQDDGNMIAITDYEVGTGSNAENLDFDWTTRLISDYPLIAMDFDVMSFTGSHSAGVYFRLRHKVSDKTTDLNLMDKIPFSSLGLSSEAYDWQHVTIIVEMKDDYSFAYHVYVDGAFVKTIKDTKKQATITSNGYTSKTLTINYARFLSSANTAGHCALDNIKVTHYKDGTSFEDIANYIYNYGDYPTLYKYTVATVTDLEGNVAYYDSLDKALSDIKEGEKLTLCENVTDKLIINKAIKVDTNAYTFDWGSTEGYVAEVADGIYTFTKSTELVTVKWDAPCGVENCTCILNHKLNNESIVVIGNVPEYLYDFDVVSEEKGLVSTFLGWSYENDGTVDELKAITADDVLAGTLNLYPVYNQAQYDFSLTVKGEVTYYTSSQFAEIVAKVNVADNVERTVTLLRDATVFDQMVLNATRNSKYVKVIFDLRGNTLDAVKLAGNKLDYNNETQQYDSTAVTVASAYLFSVPNKTGCLGYTTLTVISSAESNGTINTYKVTGDAYFKDGYLERYGDGAVLAPSHLIHMYNSKYYTCNLSNVNIHASRFIYASGGNNTYFKVNIDNVNFYETSSSVAANMKDSYTFYFESNSSFDVKINDSLFYYPEGLLGTNVFMRCHGKSGGKHNITVDNTDIIAETEQDIFNIYNATLTTDVNFNNCRLYNGNGNLTYTTYLGDGTLYTSTLHKDSTTTIPAGYVSTPSVKTESYTIPVSTAPVIGADGQVSIGADTTTKEISYAYEVKKCSEVAESFDDVRLSMLYYSNFNMVLYLEANADATVTELRGFTYTGNAKIEGKEYYAYTKECSVTGVSDDVIAKLTYKIDGKSYRQTFVVSALIYAELVLESTDIEVEETAITNMIRFIKEARTEAGLSIPTKINELQTLYPLDAYKDQAEYDDLDVEYTGLAGTSLAFAVSGNSASYVIKLPTATFADAENAVVTVKYADGSALGGTGEFVTETDAEGAEYSYYKYTTNSDRVYNIVEKPIEITITMDETVLTGTYSLGAYIQGTNNALAKAMYEFGVAAKAYREYLETL